MDVMTKDVREAVSRCILYADDIVLCSEGKEELRLERWRAALEERRMRISRSKTEYVCSNITEDGGNSIRLGGEGIKRLQKFKYLGSILEDSGSMDQEVRHRIQAGWNNWRSASGVLCDKVSLILKGMFHRTVVRPAMLYGTETASMRKTEEKKMDVAEMRMLRWMLGVTMEDRIRNEYVRGSAKLVEISKKIQEGSPRWYGHLLRREEHHVGILTMEMEVWGRRKKGRGETKKKMA
ncbi:uncharacterized protein LOC135218125 [Macrobrachium nipponense]|uniref:uncharacterized protein LOC135218125 n=1 Tax=Macrobrachium nipponense TaxID=159736 RepID=UPI0030C80721